MAQVAAGLKSSTSAFAAAAAAAAASTAAGAADLTPLLTKAPAALPVQGWQGLYVGASAGASWLRSLQDDTAAMGGISLVGIASSSTGGANTTAQGVGWLAGAQLGYNWQHSNFVFGLEGDFSWLGNNSASSDSSGTRSYRVGPGTYSYGVNATRDSKVKDLAIIRGRFGIDLNGTLPYLTAGVALGRITNTFSVTTSFGAFRRSPPPATFTSTQTSWVPGLALGGGIEHQLDQHWTVRGEIMWVGFPDKKLANPLPTSTAYTAMTSNGAPIVFSNDLVLGTVGFNYRF
jgi:outer membrane immunogenic protein